MQTGATIVILLAAGASRRMGGVDKLWADLGGRPLLAWSLERLASLEEVDGMVVVAPSKSHAKIATCTAGLRPPVRYVEGGAERRHSVAAGIGEAPEAAWYLVHDAARPLASAELARRVLAAAQEQSVSRGAKYPRGAAVPGLPVADTLKIVEADGRVRETPARASLRAIQTPQAFAGPLLRRAHREVEGAASDDAVLIERLGEPVWVVDGEPEALKVTTDQDLARVRQLAAEQEPGGR